MASIYTPPSPASADQPSPAQSASPRAFVYAADSEISATAQMVVGENYYHRFLEPRGFAWGGVFADNSAFVDRPLSSRPAGHRLSVSLDQGDVVIIPKMTAAFLDSPDIVRTLQAWVSRGVAVHLPEHGGLELAGKVAQQAVEMLAKVMALASSLNGQRIKRALRVRRAMGKPYGTPPYGFKTAGPHGDRYYLADTKQRAIGKRIVELHQAGLSFERIWSQFWQEGVCTRKGKELSLGTIKRMHAAELRLAAAEAEQSDTGRN